MDIRDLIKEPESKTLEFKRDASSLPPIMRSIVAFANTAGGIIVIGIEDDGTIRGLSKLQALKDTVANAITDNIKPLILPEIRMITIDQHNLLLIKVHHGPGPFYIKKFGKKEGVYVRLGAVNRQAPPEMIREMQRLKENAYFDQLPCNQSSEADLDFELINKIFAKNKHKMTPSKLITLNVFCKQSGTLLPTNGGIILFGTEEFRAIHFPNTQVSCARFSGTDKSEFIDRLDLNTGILNAINEIPKFIRRNTRMAAKIEEIKRQDIPEYPTVAIREALINAFVHANYEVKGSRIYVAIYDDRIEIQNPGIFPPGMTFDTFKSGVSSIRNPMIARIFREKEKLEAWGGGYERIAKSCQKGGYPIPKWEELGTVMRVTFYPRPEIGNLPVAVEPSISQQAEPMQMPKLNNKKLKLLKYCQKPRSITEVMNMLKIKHRTNFRNNYINPLLEMGYLEMTIPEKPNSKLQKYRCTTLGQKAVENQ